MPSKNLVLRTMYIDPEVDDELRTEAFDTRTSKNDLLRKYLKMGMDAAKRAGVKVSATETSTATADLDVGAIRKPRKAKADAVSAAAKGTITDAKGARKARPTSPVARKAPKTSAQNRVGAPNAQKATAGAAPQKKVATPKATSSLPV